MRSLQLVILSVLIALLTHPTPAERIGAKSFLDTRDRCLRPSTSTHRHFAPQYAHLISFKDDVSYQEIEAIARGIKDRFAVAHIPGTVLYSALFKGFTVQNVTTEKLSAHLADKETATLHRSKMFRSLSSVPWGLDRIDQKSLPRDNQYRPQFNGSGSSIFIVDTGIDTNHIEFKGSHRIVKNLYDTFSGGVSTDNDVVGHGTHTAATAGGNTVGVAPLANVYGIRVMDQSGSGTSVDIINGLSFVLDWFLHHKKPPTVVSMSLGGNCLSYEECEKDAIVQACEKLISNGITVIVAAGNDGCDSCLQTPAFAPNVITVGASNSMDQAALFSDFGKCVDIYAPGEYILSACAKALCDSELKYTYLSGTSMAAPHAAGVAAMIYQMQRGKAILPKDVANIMACSGAKNKLIFLTSDKRMSSIDYTVQSSRVNLLTSSAMTRNILLQIPRNDGSAICDLGEGCNGVKGCSDHGYCQGGTCLCDTTYWGTSCESKAVETHCSNGEFFIQYTLYHSSPTPWVGINFAVENTASGQRLLSTSMCSSTEESSGFCASPNTEYKLTVTGQSGTGKVAWKMCNRKGGTPFLLRFELNSQGECIPKCHSVETEILLFPGLSEMWAGRGWAGSYYKIYSVNNGDAIAGGTLLPHQSLISDFDPLNLRGSSLLQLGGDKISQRICLEDGEYVLLLDSPKDDMKSYASATDSGKPFWALCDHIGVLGVDFVFIKISGAECYVIPPTSVDDISLSASEDQVFKKHALVIGAFDLSVSSAWLGHKMSVYSIGKTTKTISVDATIQNSLFHFAGNDSNEDAALLGTSTLTTGAASQSSVSLHHPDANGVAGYFPQFRISPSIPKSDVSSNNVFWVACGVHGALGENYKFRYEDREYTQRLHATGVESPNCFEQCLSLNLLTVGKGGYLADDENLFYFIHPVFPGKDDDEKVVDVKMLDGYVRNDNKALEGKNNVCVGDRSNGENILSCYKMYIGAGNVLNSPLWSFCGVNISSTSTVEFCVRDSTECQLINATNSHCQGGEQASYFVMLSSSQASSWAGSTYQISTPRLIFGEDIEKNDLDETVIAAGKLSSTAWFGQDSLCMPDGCYRLRTSIGTDPERVNWFYCGTAGGAGDEIVFKLSGGYCSLQASMTFCENPLYSELSDFMMNNKYLILFIVSFIFYYGLVNLLSFCMDRPAEGPITVGKRFSLSDQGLATNSSDELPPPLAPRRLEIDLARTRRQQQVALVDPTKAIDPSRVTKAISGSLARAFPQHSSAASGYMKLEMEQSSHGGDEGFDNEIANADDGGNESVEMTTNVMHSNFSKEEILSDSDFW